MKTDKSIKAPKAARSVWDEFKNAPNPTVRERANSWAMAIGLQDVDHLSVSDFLVETAKRHIRGEITIGDVRRIIEAHYAKGKKKAKR